MNWLAFSVFYGATTISLVESGCFGFHPLTKNFDNLYNKWWNKAFVKYNGMSSDRKSCINSIVKNCPKMVTITSSVRRSFDGRSQSYEIWTIIVTATLRAHPNLGMEYAEEKKKSICCDEGVPACNHWWKIATMNGINNETREICISRIFKHCSSKIEKTFENRNTNDLPSKRFFEVVTSAYKYDGDTTSFSHYVRQKNCC